MNPSPGAPSDQAATLPKPVIRNRGTRVSLIWLVPLLAIFVAVYSVHDRLLDRGVEITLRFTDATGLKAGESKVMHLGVQVGVVSGIELSPDRKQALAHIRLRRSESSFATKGAAFWIVRPEISMQEISGLGTVLSGPIIDSNPGDGELQTDFDGSEKPPTQMPEGLSIILRTPNLQRLQPDSPVFFRGIQVGLVQDIQLSSDATSAEIHALIQRRYIPLVKANSQFWTLSAIDLKGGLFSGVQMKVESLRSLMSGGVAFATPDDKIGLQAQNGDAFDLHDEAKKEWLVWSAKIAIEPNDPARGDKDLTPPKERQTTGAAVGPN